MVLFRCRIADINTVEELAQEVFYRLCKHTSMEGTDGIAWKMVSRTMNHVWRDHIKQLRRAHGNIAYIVDREDLIDSQMPGPSDWVEMTDTFRSLHDLLRRELLDEGQVQNWLIISSLYFWGMTVTDLAQNVLRTPRTTIAKRHQNLLRRLKYLLMRHGLALWSMISTASVYQDTWSMV